MIEIGHTATVTQVVTDANTAHTMGSGSLAVYATPSMVALMEQAACVAVEGLLEPGQTTVGIKVDIEHLAPSPVGETITATATIDAISGKKIELLVVAHDSNGRIGQGVHHRVIVSVDKFMSKLTTQPAGN